MEDPTSPQISVWLGIKLITYSCYLFMFYIFYVFALEQNRAVHLSLQGESSKFYYGSFSLGFYWISIYFAAQNLPTLYRVSHIET